MKRSLVLTFALSLLILNTFSCQDKKEEEQAEKRKTLIARLNELSSLDPGGYKSAKWGMSVSDVSKTLRKARYGGLDDFSFMAGKGAYVQVDNIAGAPSSILYFFDNKQLATVVIFYDQDLMHVNNSTIFDYTKLERLLTDKYGPPVSTKRTGSAESIALGDGEYSAFWAFPRKEKSGDDAMSELDPNRISTYLTLRLGKSEHRFVDGIILTVMYNRPPIADARSRKNDNTDF